MSLFWSRFPPGAETSGEVSHGAEVQIVFALRGEIELHINDRHHLLSERCTIMFSGQTPHSWANRTTKPAEILTILVPAVFSG